VIYYAHEDLAARIPYNDVFEDPAEFLLNTRWRKSYGTNESKKSPTNTVADQEIEQMRAKLMLTGAQEIALRRELGENPENSAVMRKLLTDDIAASAVLQSAIAKVRVANNPDGYAKAIIESAIEIEKQRYAAL